MSVRWFPHQGTAKSFRTIVRQIPYSIGSAIACFFLGSWAACLLIAHWITPFRGEPTPIQPEQRCRHGWIISENAEKCPHCEAFSKAWYG
jgi:hypothetical protein